MRQPVFAIYYPSGAVPAEGDAQPDARAEVQPALLPEPGPDPAPAPATEPEPTADAGIASPERAFASFPDTRPSAAPSDDAAAESPEAVGAALAAQLQGGEPPSPAPDPARLRAGVEATAQAFLAFPLQGMRAEDVAHETLGLFAPDVITVRARVGQASWAGMGKPRAGLYRPEGFRPAPWNGLAYDVAPADGRGVGAGARVLTARGEVAVEELVPQDRVLGLRGPRLAEVTWIGRRSLPPATGDAAPVRVPAGALGEAQPSHDVIVGPDQTLFPDGANPVPARELVRTGAAVRAEGRETELFQVALRPYPGSEGGDVLLVDGIFAASRSAPG